MQRIIEDIKSGNFKNIYLLYGKEDYLRKQYRDKLRDAMVDVENTMNYNYFEGKDISIPALIDLAETLPFLAERRVIVVENSELFKKSADELADYLKGCCETTHFLFVEKEIDKRNKLYKAVDSNGLCVEFTTPDETTLKRWIAGMLKNEGKKITERDVLYFIEKTGTDMENIRTELEKLVCYCQDKEIIQAEDIDEICTKQITNQIFEMINAMAEKRQKKAMELYYDLLALKEPPMRILSLISRQFNLLLQVSQLKAKGYDNKKIADKTGLKPFIVGKYIAQCSKFKQAELKEALQACLDADEAVKTGKMTDLLSVELLLVKYSSMKRG